MGSNFSKIKIGTLFTTSDEETFRKTSELIFEDMAGIERYIDPLFDRKIGKEANVKADVNTSARIVKDEPVKKAVKKKAKKTVKKSSAKKSTKASRR